MSGEVPIRTVGTPSVSGPSGPSKAAPSVDYSPNTLGEGMIKTVTDGKTQVTTSGPNRTSDSIAERRKGGGNDSINDDVARGAREHYFQQHGQWPPCINTSCKSYGHPHKNCLCFGNHSDAGNFYASGGEVCSSKLEHHASCEHFADGGQIVENSKFHNDPKQAIDHAAVSHGLLGLLTKVGHSRSEDKSKHFTDYVGSHKKGKKDLHSHVENIFNSNKIEPDKNSREALKAHIEELKRNPEHLLDVGGNLGDNLPTHSIQLAALAGNALNHFSALKPVQHKNKPLDKMTPPDKRTEAIYDRHIDIAQNPMLILQHAKDGTLLPSDLMTLRALYPELEKSLVSKAGEALITAESEGREIPYKQKQSLSLLLGQPMDSTMTSESMQAIIKSAGPQQAKQQQKAQPKPKKATGVELNQLNKVNSLYATNLQDREMDRLKD